MAGVVRSPHLAAASAILLTDWGEVVELVATHLLERGPSTLAQLTATELTPTQARLGRFPSAWRVARAPPARRSPARPRSASYWHTSVATTRGLEGY